MAKGKNLNPADAYRKAQRKKEVKKNKTERQKNRGLALVKKDTTEIEDEIKSLEEKTEPSSGDKSRLTELKAELEKINKKKEEYVAEHPEKRNLVYRKRRTEEEKAQANAVPAQRTAFNKKGLPRHPERSVYYDPVMNPYGVPPPGMPYMERPLQPGEVDPDHGEHEDEPNAILPGPYDEPVGSDDDIHMPDGPPPGQAPIMGAPFVPPLPAPGTAPQFAGFLGAMPLPPPPPPSGFPPVAFPHAFPNFPPTSLPGPPLPQPPPGFLPRQQSVSSLQDPLAGIPHTTYQAHQGTRSSLPSHPSLPEKPVAAITAAATVSAEPQLRDLKKEATSFVPYTLKRKRQAASGVSSAKVNAAPALTDDQETPEPSLARPDLLSTLRDQFGAPPMAKTDTSKSIPPIPAKKNDDYDKFVEEIGDILGSGPYDIESA
ncbi:WW domain binding protein 11-domain-containing protein [Amanita rubescens]|nr:WW domain binding protein 11-domain-containing protein [Amanita rubescens]